MVVNVTSSAILAFPELRYAFWEFAWLQSWESK
jgi:hypothetical protein